MQFLLSADFSLTGRCDPSMLTQQQMVELFFTPDFPQKSREDLKGDPDDACTWEGVECTDAGDIHRIQWQSWDVDLMGSIDFKMVPLTVEFINFYDQGLHGEIDTTAFPDSFRALFLQQCLFTGTIDLSRLPPRMCSFKVMNNKITGVCNVQNIPETVRWLKIQEKNIVDKTIRIGALPESTLKLDFLTCGFTKVLCDRESDAKRVQIQYRW